MNVCCQPVGKVSRKCGRPAKFLTGDVWYCGIHEPDRVEKIRARARESRQRILRLAYKRAAAETMYDALVSFPWRGLTKESLSAWRDVAIAAISTAEGKEVKK